MSSTTSDPTALLGLNTKAVAAIPDELPHSVDEASRYREVVQSLELDPATDRFGSRFDGVMEMRSALPVTIEYFLHYTEANDLRNDRGTPW